MKKYEKPAMEIVRLTIEENIAAKVPTTFYDDSAVNGTFAKTGVELFAVS